MSGNELQKKTKVQLIEEVRALRERVVELEGDGTATESPQMISEESKQRHHQILELLHEGIWAIDRDARTTYVNSSMARMLGYSKAEMSGKHLFDFMDADGVDLAKRNLQRRQQGIGEQHEFEFLRKDGTPVHALLKTNPVLDENGQYGGAIAGVVDITDRKRTEKELVESQRLLEVIMGSTPQAGVLLDVEFNIMGVTRVFAEAAGHEVSFFTGKNYFDLYPDIDIEKLFRRIVQTGESYSAVAEPSNHPVFPDLAKSHWEWRLAPIRDQDEAVRESILLLTDITEEIELREALQKRTEELGERVKELSFLYHIATNIFARRDLPLEKIMQGTVDSLPSAYQYPEITCARLVMNDKVFKTHDFEVSPWGQSAGLFFTGKRNGQLEVYVKERRQSSAFPFLEEEQKLLDVTAQRLGKVIEHRHAEDELQKYQMRLEEVIDERSAELRKANEQLLGEILERKETEQRLLTSQQELHELSMHLEDVREKERTAIAREIHDELGQVLTAMKMDLSWCQKRFGEGSELLLQKIASMSELVDSMIRTVKKISVQLRPGILDDLGLAPAIEWLTGDFQKRTGILCTVVFEPHDISLAEDQSTALFRIAQEAMTNIARHSGAKNATIALKQSEKWIGLEIHDDGKGIEDENTPGSRSFGLIGMRERAYSLGGHFTIQGIPGQGTTVTVRIPHEAMERDS